MLKKALFTVALGSNDFLDNYLTPLFSIPERLLVSPESFVATLISRLRLQLTVILLKQKALFQSCFYSASWSHAITILQRLFNLGARKIVVANVGPIGCIPYIRDVNLNLYDEYECVTFPNELAQLFNAQLKSLVEELRTKLEGSLFVYADVYHIMEDILMNYKDYGL